MSITETLKDRVISSYDKEIDQHRDVAKYYIAKFNRYYELFKKLRAILNKCPFCDGECDGCGADGQMKEAERTRLIRDKLKETE